MKKITKKLTLNKKTIAHLNKGTLAQIQGGVSYCECEQECSEVSFEGCDGGTSVVGGGGGTYDTCASCVGLSCDIECGETVTGDPMKDCWFCE